jgi:nitroreductase
MNPKLNLIFARRSVRAYQPQREIPSDLVCDLLEAAMAAPSACAKDPWRFIVIRDRKRLAAIADGLPNGKMLPDAGIGIVVCGDLQAANGNDLGYLLQDCAAAIENLLIAAHALGLGGCWLGVHPRPERATHLRKLLGIPETVVPVGVMALGWPAEADKPPRTRFNPEYIHEETW